MWGRGSKRTGYFTFYDDGVVVIRGDRGLYFHENTGGKQKSVFILLMTSLNNIKQYTIFESNSLMCVSGMR